MKEEKTWLTPCSLAHSHWRESGPVRLAVYPVLGQNPQKRGSNESWVSPPLSTPLGGQSPHSTGKESEALGGGGGVPTSAGHRFWSRRKLLLERAEREKCSLLVLKNKGSRCFPLGGERQNKVCISQDSHLPHLGESGDLAAGGRERLGLWLSVSS